MATYRQQRNYENLNKAMFDGEGQYDIPILAPAECDVENWISFNFAKGCEEPERHGVHFFIDDYQFNRVWTSPDVYVEMLGRFQAVCTPDFSTYTDFPKAIQIYNHYRKHWLGAYWQAHGMTVIPTISWSDHDSYEWCFDGEPVGSTVIVSSVGTQSGMGDTAQLFLDGYYNSSIIGDLPIFIQGYTWSSWRYIVQFAIFEISVAFLHCKTPPIGYFTSIDKFFQLYHS